MFISALSIFTIGNKLIIALLLFFKKNNSLPNKILSFIVLLPMLTVLSNFLLYLEDYRFDFLLFINQIGVHSLSALIYIYCLLIMGKEVKINARFPLYFISNIVPIGCWIVYSFFYSEARQTLMLREAYTNPDILWVIMNTAINTTFLFYLSLSLYKVRKHNREVRKVYSELQILKLKWLNEFVGLMLLLGLILVASYILLPQDLSLLIVLPILSNIFYFYIVYQSFNNSALFTKEEFSDFQKKFTPLEKLSAEKYQKSALSEILVKEYGEKISRLLYEAKLYLDPDLTIHKLSEKLELSPNKTSEVINRHFQQNFFDLINNYRVEYAKNCLVNSMYDHMVLEGIAEESGFGSKTAFNRAFKKVTGFTPSQYKKKYKTSTLTTEKTTLADR